MIQNITDIIHNYTIGNNVTIKNVSTISASNSCSFANGVIVNALNEFDGRAIRIFDKLNAQLAYLMTMFREQSNFISKVNSAIDSYIAESTLARGVIGNNCVIANCNFLNDFKCGSDCTLLGVQCIDNISIGQNTKLGFGVIMRDCIVTNDSEISDGAILHRCFVGEHCEIGEGFTANDSLIFANSVLMRGEASALFAGPYTVSHHKSTLLIAIQTSFFNAGSNSNQSNHRYRLGAIHQGITERGTKLGSSSYLLLPVKVGSFSTIIGQHHINADFSALPFSYIIDNDEPTIVPGVNLTNIGTFRDIDKWEIRDGRTTSKHDCVDFSFEDNPFIASEIYSGYLTLTNLLASAPDSDKYNYSRYTISRKALHRGLELYRKALDRYIGLCSDSNTEQQNFNWFDISGQIVTSEDLEQIFTSDFAHIDELLKRISCLSKNLDTNKRLYGRFLDYSLNGEFSNINELKSRGIEAINFFEEKLLADCQKEFAPKVSIGYINDFESVRTSQNVMSINNRLLRRNEYLRTKLTGR
jgi:carbonic anhydrase/acetyltransferase-like protein (isoleucine patch superfamily)